MRGLRLSFDGTGVEDSIEPLVVNCRHKNGATFPAEIIATVIRNPDGDALGTMKLIRDVTLQLKQAEDLRQALRLDALGQLTGGIAHDFNYLLKIIIGNLELFDASHELELFPVPPLGSWGHGSPLGSHGSPLGSGLYL